MDNNINNIKKNEFGINRNPLYDEMPLTNNYINKTSTSSMRVCRGCLATDVRLHDMRQNRLLEAYSILLSTAIQVTDDLPHYLCSYCAALLLKGDTFRIKCIDSLIVLRHAQQEHLDLTAEHIKILDQPTYLQQTVLKTINIVDKTSKHKQNYSDLSTDTDISSESDISDISSVTDDSIHSDDSIDCDLTDESDCSVSDNEDFNLKNKTITKEHTIINTEHDFTVKKSNNEIKNLLKKYFDNERSGLLKDFKVNIDCAANKTISNIRDHKMKQLSEIMNHIQYSSETSNALLNILDKDSLKCKNETSKSVTETTKKSQVIQESKSNAKAKTVNKQKVHTGKEHVQKDIVKEGTNKSVLEIESNIKPDIVNTERSNSDLIPKVEIKIEFQDETMVLENQYDEIDENLDSEDDIAIADLNLDPMPSKCKKISSKKGAANYKGCKSIINGILKGRRTNRIKFTEEFYAMYNTDVRHLTREEQIKEVNYRKESANYKNGQFKCNICYKGFLIKETYENHMSLHDDISGKFVCDICHCHFITKRRLFGHKKGHTKVFTCRECGHTTKNGSAAAEHFKWHSGKKFSCKDCGKEFKKKSSKYGHIKMCHPTSDQLVRCEICGDSFNGLAGLQHHDKRSHKEMYSPECHCSSCDTQFYCSDAFKAHQGTDGLCDTTYKYCVRCGMSFETEQLLKEHEIEAQKPQNQFKCDVCHKTFKFFSKLKTHQRSHSTTYSNYINARKMKSEKELQECGSENMICEKCGKSVKNAGLLKLHYSMVHLSEKPYKCTICPKEFKTSALLVVHMRVHTGERPYQCQHCSKAFQNPQNLKRHDMVHTGERPHSCDICGKSFQSRSSVKMHIKTVHMKIPMPPRIRRRNVKT